jgi:hypothetical protein
LESVEKTEMKFFLPIFILFLFSCDKDNSCRDCRVHDVTATVVWTGELAVDGCDWCIQTDSLHFYHPDVLDTAFRYDRLAVTVSYELTSEKFFCGGAAGLPVIHITDIKK